MLLLKLGLAVALVYFLTMCAIAVRCIMSSLEMLDELLQLIHTIRAETAEKRRQPTLLFPYAEEGPRDV